MPTYADQIDAGEGRFKARAVIEGWPAIYVSHASLVRTLSDGRRQVLGLDPRNLRLAARAELARGRLSQQEQTIEIVEDDERTIASTLAASPGRTTYVNVDVSKTATTIDVVSTAGFPSSGVIHIGTEAIHYANKSPTQFTGCTRGFWGTIAQAHQTADGDRLAYPKVTDTPRTLRGRRVLIYLYGEADDVTGDGTLRWRGLSRSDRDYHKGRWTTAVEPISYVLEQPIGGDLEEPVPIGGIYLPASGALTIGIQRWDSASWTGGAATTSDFGFVRLAGRWTSNAEFVADLNTELVSLMTGWSLDADAELRAEALGNSGWRLVYRTTSTGTTPHMLTITGVVVPESDGRVGVSPVDFFAAPVAGGTLGDWIDTGGAPSATLSKNAVYTMDFDAPVPRAVVGEPPGRTYFNDPARPEFAADRVYLGGVVVPSSSMFVSVRPDGDDSDDQRFSSVVAANTTERYVTIRGMPQARLGPNTRVRLARTLATGAYLHQLIDTLRDDSPDLVNTGAMPLIGPDDFDYDWAELRSAIAELRLASRIWVTQEGVTLAEILEHELRLVGAYLALDETGRMSIRRITPALSTDPAAASIDSTQVLGWPATTFNAEGNLVEVLIHQGWDWIEGEHKGLPIRVRNIEAADPTPLGGVLTVAPRSRATVTGDYGLEVDPEDAYSLAAPVLGMFGGSYKLITLPAKMGRGAGSEALFNVPLGETVIVTSPQIPDAGSIGVVQKPMKLIGYDWSPFTGRGELTMLDHSLRVAGYAPGFKVASSTGSGTVHTLTLTLTGYTDATNISDWLAVGDRVRVLEYDNAAPSSAYGDITAITDPNQVEVTFDLSFTPYAEMTLGYDNADAVDETAPSGRRWAQKQFGFMGDADRLITFASGDEDAQEFSP